MGLAVGNIQLAQLNQAFTTMRQARLNCSHNNSVWPLAHTWNSEQHRLLKAYHAGTYQLSPQTTYAIKDELISQFTACDAVLFRAIAQQIKKYLSSKLSKTIMHLKGYRSIKGVLLCGEGRENHRAARTLQNVSDCLDDEQQRIGTYHLPRFSTYPWSLWA